MKKLDHFVNILIRQCKFEKLKFPLLLLQLRTAGLLPLKIEWANKYSLLNWDYMSGCHTQRQCQDWKRSLARLVFQKNRSYMWGHHSSKKRPSLTKPPYIGSPESKDCRVVKPGNWVCKLNFRLELGLYMGLSPQRQCLNWQSPLV